MQEGTQRIGKRKRGVRGRGNTMTKTSKDFCNPAIVPLGQSRSSRGGAGRKSAPAHKGFNTVGDRCGGSRTNIEQTQHLELADGNGHIAQQEPLGEYAVSRFGQRQKTSIWSRMVERWVESACG
jgi:hypothetical protein